MTIENNNNNKMYSGSGGGGDTTTSNETTPLLLVQHSTTGSTDVTTTTTGPSNDNDHNNNNDNNNNSSNNIDTNTTIILSSSDWRYSIFLIVEGKTIIGNYYEKFMILLIVINVILFIIGTLFDTKYNNTTTNANNYADPITGGICNYTCDLWLFGNYKNNIINNFLSLFGVTNIQLSTSTSIIELFTIILFTIDYIIRFITCDYINPTLYSYEQNGIVGRLKWMISFFSIVDLLSIVPFYIDTFIIVNNKEEFTGTAFVRMFRLLRIMHMEGKYNTALTMVDDVFTQQKSILLTASFVGITTWIVISSLYYLTERTNTNFIYCPSCPDVDKESYCTIDTWGYVNCTGDPCVDNAILLSNTTTATDSTICYNLYESIPSSSYYALLNLFGEFPHITDHSTYGKIVAIITTVVAVAVFALPVGIIGNGFEQVIQQEQIKKEKIQQKLQLQLLQQQQQQQQQQIAEQQQSNTTLIDNRSSTIGTITTTTIDDNNDLRIRDSVLTINYKATVLSIRGQLYNILHAQIGYVAYSIDILLNILIVVTSIQYMIETTGYLSKQDSYHLDLFEFIAVSIFTIEYLLRVYSCVEDPKYNTTANNTNNNNNNNTRKYTGRLKYMITFLAVVDLLSFAPYWIQKIINSIVTKQGTGVSSNTTGTGSNWLFIGNDTDNFISSIVSSLRLLRILRFERYTHAFTTFDDVISNNYIVLTITMYTAILVWIFFSAILYVTERNNPNIEMSSNYNTLPNSMWITLLNLSGEAPLSEYTIIGKVVTGILGIFATGIFGIPIGVLGAGFEQIVGDENKDNTEELQRCASDTITASTSEGGDSNTTTTGNRNVSTTTATDNDNNDDAPYDIEVFFYNFANGIGSLAAQQFELLIYFFIFIAAAIGCYQTIDGQANAFNDIENLAILIFTIEYVFRLIGAPADPLFNRRRTNTIATGIRSVIPWPILCRIKFICSFYSVVDLLAIIPFYLSLALPNSFLNDYDEYLRMLRIIRLVKLDKYVPSITLVDDVLRLKFEPLCVAFYAAATLWALFAAAMFLCEQNDTSNSIDPVPSYGCTDDCTMADRFQNFFDSVYYSGIHLTGDYPITTYSWPARIVCFFMVIAAVGVVSIPSGLIASGFVEIVKTRSRAAAAAAAATAEAASMPLEEGETESSGVRTRSLPQQGHQLEAGDDWYEIQYRLLENQQPRGLMFDGTGSRIDKLQVAVNEFLNGRKVTNRSTVVGGAHVTEKIWTPLAYCVRVFIFLIIVANVIAVVLESIPSIDKAIGNEDGNFFDRFEVVSVFIFATEYMLRLFCAPKNREALYSTYVYATTFFGIVDLLSTAPWFIEQLLLSYGVISPDDVFTKTFRIFRIFRILQLEDFLVAFRKLDNVFRASKDVLKATGLLALIIWVGCGALFFIFEENNPNWRSCKDEIPPYTDNPNMPGCYDFKSTADCNKVYPGMCVQVAFTDMPNTLYYTAVFLGGEWGLVDFTWPGRFVALFLCVFGIGLYAIPIGTLFNSFGAVLGLADDEDDDEEENDGTVNNKQAVEQVQDQNSATTTANTGTAVTTTTTTTTIGISQEYQNKKLE